MTSPEDAKKSDKNASPSDSPQGDAYHLAAIEASAHAYRRKRQHGSGSSFIAGWAIATAVIVVVSVLCLLLAGANGWLFRQTLRVVASARSATADATAGQPVIDVKGVVLYDDQLVKGADVSAIVEDGIGNGVGSDFKQTDDKGAFLMKISGVAAPKAVTLAARYQPSDYGLPQRASETIFLDNTGKRVQSLHWSSAMVVVVIFAMSVFLALANWTVEPSSFLYELQSFAWPRIQYYCLIILACVLSLTVVWAFGSTMRELDAIATANNELNLGFANISKGSYVRADAPQEWLFSLTSRAYASENDEPTQQNAIDLANADPGSAEKSGHHLRLVGFGAPVWVLFLGAIGSMLLTVSLVVDEIADPPSFEVDQRKTLTARMQKFVQHGFFVLSSPFTGIFVYQLLVVMGSAHSPITVALVALGVGPLINALLTRAMDQASQALKQTAGNPPSNNASAGKDKGK